MISVLMLFWQKKNFSLKTAAILSSPSLAVVFTNLWFHFKKILQRTCEKVHKNPLCQKRKSRYHSASLTAEASLAFPVFFFAVLYLVQMFSVLRAELVIAEAGITSAREVAAYSYVAERLADGENAIAGKLLDLFDQKIVRDATMTGVFHFRCDKEILQQAHVAQGYSGIWVSTEESGDKTQAEIYYKVKPQNVLTEEKGRFYVMRLIYRNWTGEGRAKNSEDDAPEEKNTVYMTEHGTVYHLYKNCSYIKIDVTAVLSEHIGGERNLSGAKYYACEFCDPVLKKGTQVFITEYGTRYHASSTCSAIKRNVKECSLEEVQKTYKECSRCRKKKEGGS